LNLIAAMGKECQHLPAIIEQYEEDLEDAEKHISIKGKTLEGANVEHASWMSYYDQKRVELSALMKFLEREVERIRGKLWVQYTEKMSLALNTRDKENYINNEPAYLAKQEQYLMVKEIHDKYSSLVDAFKSRGFALNNIVKLRTSAIENEVI
jgi:hypothetical protein